MPKPTMITFQGRTQSIPDWAREMGLAPVTLHYRLNRGWSVEEALSLPKDARRETAPSPLPEAFKAKHQAPDSSRWGKLAPKPMSVKLPQELYDYVAAMGPQERQPWLREAIWEAYTRDSNPAE